MNNFSEQPAKSPLASTGSSMDRPVKRSLWRRIRLWAVCGGILVIGVAGAIILLPRPGSVVAAAQEMRTAPARIGMFDDVLPLRATIEPLRTVFLDAVESGRVASLLAEDGQLVSEGQLIATLVNPQLALQVVGQEAAISGQLGSIAGQKLSVEASRLQQQQALNEAKYNLLQADRALEIKRHLNSLNIESEAAVRAAATSVDYYRAQVHSAERAQNTSDNLFRAQAREMNETTIRLNANLRAARGSLDALQIRAPVAGRLTALDLDIGETIQPGARIAQVDSEQEYKLTADIDEFYLGRLAVGRKGHVADRGRTLPITVSRLVSQVVDGKFRAELTFDDGPPVDARRGQTLDARLTLGQSRQAILVPLGPWLETTGGRWIFVLDESGRSAKRREITVGRRNPTDVEVLSGLTKGEHVITSSYAVFKERDRLAIR